MLAFEHTLDSRNNCGDLTHVTKRNIDISVATSLAVYQMFFRRRWLAIPAQTKPLVRGPDVFSHKGISAIPSPLAASRSAFSSFEHVIHQSHFITMT